MRKERSDKKKAINPTVPLALHDALARLAYVCNCPLKDIGETLCDLGVHSRPVIERLSPRFRRSYDFTDYVTMYGDPDREPFREEMGPSQRRINLRLQKPIYEKIKELAFALDTSLTRATTQLIQETLNNNQVFADLLARFVQRELDERRMEQLEEVLDYINGSEPEEEQVTLSVLLDYLLATIGDATRKMTDVVGEWMENKKPTSKVVRERTGIQTHH